MITYTVRDESRTEIRMLTRKKFSVPCFRVYREDGTCMATYDNADEANTDAEARIAEDADITWGEIEAERASR